MNGAFISFPLEVKTINYALSSNNSFVLFLVDLTHKIVRFQCVQQHFIDNAYLYDKVLTTSRYTHVATSGVNKYSNPAKVTTAAKNNKVTIKVKKSFKLKGAYAASAKKYKIKKVWGMRYESTNTKIATVSKTGVIKAKKKGPCYVYAFAQNGVAKKIKVTVKK